MALVLVLFLHGSVWGYDLTDKFSIGGIIGAAYQYQWLDDDKNGEADDSIGRGAVNFEPEFSFRPNDSNELFAKVGFGAGNGLNAVTDFRLAPWVKATTGRLSTGPPKNFWMKMAIKNVAWPDFSPLTRNWVIFSVPGSVSAGRMTRR